MACVWFVFCIFSVLLSPALPLSCEGGVETCFDVLGERITDVARCITGHPSNEQLVIRSLGWDANSKMSLCWAYSPPRREPGLHGVAHWQVRTFCFPTACHPEMTLAWLSRYTVLTKWSFSVPSTSCSWWHSTRKASFSIPQFQFLGKIISTLSAFLCEVQSLLLETGRVSEAKYGVQPEFAYANIHIFMQMHMHTMPCRCSWSAMSSERHWNLVFSGYYSNGWTMTKYLKPVQELQQVCPSLSTMSVHMHATACIWRSQYDFHETVLSFQFVYEAGYLLFLLSCVLRAR